MSRSKAPSTILGATVDTNAKTEVEAPPMLESTAVTDRQKGT
jgi:hypothetical protein